jgi:thiamine transporter
LGTLLGATGRVIAHIFSGVIFFAEYAPETQNVWVYSTIYNLGYLAPSALGVALIAAVTLPVLKQVLGNQEAGESIQ